MCRLPSNQGNSQKTHTEIFYLTPMGLADIQNSTDSPYFFLTPKTLFSSLGTSVNKIQGFISSRAGLVKSQEETMKQTLFLQMITMRQPWQNETRIQPLVFTLSRDGVTNIDINVCSPYNHISAHVPHSQKNICGKTFKSILPLQKGEYGSSWTDCNYQLQLVFQLFPTSNTMKTSLHTCQIRCRKIQNLLFAQEAERKWHKIVKTS